MAKYIDHDLEECECRCDECGYETMVESTDYSDINKSLREDNWIVKKIDDEWHEFCSEKCLEDFIESK